MRKDSPLLIVWDRGKIVDMIIHCPTTSHTQPDKTEIELVRIFNEHKQLQAELEQHRWIPVSERLPEKGEQVVVHWNMRVDDRVDDLELVIWDNDWPDEKSITHWKPIILPEQAWKENEDEKRRNDGQDENEKYNLPCPYNLKVMCVQIPCEPEDDNYCDDGCPHFQKDGRYERADTFGPFI